MGGTWPQEPHTRAKHDILRGYIEAWFAILGSQRGRIMFIDGFAGPGVYDGGEPGSPIIVLEALLDHGHLPRLTSCEFVFLFNERKPDHFASLCQVLGDLERQRGGWPKNVKVYVSDKSFGDMADGLIAHRDGGRRLAPAFAFIDPFGYVDVSVKQIGELLRSPTSEAFIYLDSNSVNRFGTAGTNVDKHFETLFGTTEFRGAPPSGHPDRMPYFIDLFRRQLKDLGGFTYTWSFAMRNQGNRIVNHMVFATNHLTGLDKMKASMWRVDPSGGYEFSDHLAGQEVLFKPEPNFPALRAALLRRFGGQTVGIEDVRAFVIEHTPFFSGQLKTATLAPMERDGLLDATGRTKRCTYPDGSCLTFHSTA